MIADLTAERDQLLTESTREKTHLTSSLRALRDELDGYIFERDQAASALKKAKQAFEIERSSLEEQLAKSRKLNDQLHEDLSRQQLKVIKSAAEKQEAQHVSQQEHRMRCLLYTSPSPRDS